MRRQLAPERRSLLLVLVTLLAACRYGYDPLVGDDDVDADADVASDAGCDPLTPLAETFSGAVAPRWAGFGGGGAVASTVNGRLRVTLPGSPSGMSAYAGYVTPATYDLSGHAISVEAPVMVNLATHAQGLFQVHDAVVGSRAGFEQQHGTLTMFVSGLATTASAAIPYDPSMHRRWRLREASGTLFFETSADGQTWSLHLQAPSSLDAARVTFELSGGQYQPETGPGFVEFDNLGGTVPVGAACP